MSKVIGSINSAINFDLNPSLLDYMEVLSCFHFIPCVLGESEEKWKILRAVSKRRFQMKIPKTLLYSLHVPVKLQGLPGGHKPLLGGQI